MDCYSEWQQNYADMDDELERNTIRVRKNWEHRRWYSKYALSEREEDNLVMDEMEREGYRE